MTWFAGVGTPAAAAAIQHVAARYDCRGPSGDYVIDQDMAREGRWRISWLFPGRDESRFEFDGSQGWQVTAESREELPAEVGAMVRGHAFVWLLVDPECYFDGGVQTPEGWRSASGHRIEEADGLPIRITLQQAPPQQAVVIELGEWQSFGELRLPSVCVATDAAGSWEMRLAELTLR